MVEIKKLIINFHDKYYKYLLLIPLVLLLFSLGYLGNAYLQTGDFIEKDITLTGGTTITIISENVDLNSLRDYLSEQQVEFTLKRLSDFQTGIQSAIAVETTSEVNVIKPLLEDYLGYALDNDNSSIESTGSALGESFYNQLKVAIVISFILMAIVVFILFRSPIPSLAVIISAFADIVMTLAFVDLLNMKISTAGITAILMLIGYSVDSDIMLTTRILKRGESVNNRLYEAFKTGLTMTLTSLVALTVAFMITQSVSETLRQIFLILLVGLAFDILNTWITNASILKWYVEGKK